MFSELALEEEHSEMAPTLMTGSLTEEIEKRLWSETKLGDLDIIHAAQEI